MDKENSASKMTATAKTGGANSAAKSTPEKQKGRKKRVRMSVLEAAEIVFREDDELLRRLAK